MSTKKTNDLDVISSRRVNDGKKTKTSNKISNEMYSDEYEDYTVDIGDIYEEEKNERKQRKLKKKRKKRRKIALLIGEFFAISILIFVLVMLIMPNSKAWFLSTPIGKFFISIVVPESDMDKIIDKNFNRKDVQINEGLDTSAMKDYYNIALFGLDSRNDELSGGVNSDTIIIVSINKKTGHVKMCSVYRDTWVRVAKKDGSWEYNRINSAYSYGTAQEAVKTLNANFDLNISDYVSINFAGLANIIDMLGGIDIKITEDERYYLNQYLGETRIVTGINSDLVYSSGYVHLNGIQAVAFCRIRYVTFTDEDGTQYNNDYGRTARQRRVIMKMVDKAKSAGLTQVMNIANEVLNSNILYTSMPYDEIIDLIPTLLNFTITGSSGYPYTLESVANLYLADGNVLKYPVIIQGLSYNNYKMHEFLFDDKNYKPSTTVKQIEKALEGLLGYGEKRLDGDENIRLD